MNHHFYMAINYICDWICKTKRDLICVGALNCANLQVLTRNFYIPKLYELLMSVNST